MVGEKTLHLSCVCAANISVEDWMDSERETERVGQAGERGEPARSKRGRNRRECWMGELEELVQERGRGEEGNRTAMPCYEREKERGTTTVSFVSCFPSFDLVFICVRFAARSYLRDAVPARRACLHHIRWIRGYRIRFYLP